MKTSKLLKEQDRLWSYHYWLTREVIKDYVYKTGCVDVDLAALMENQQNLGDNFAKLTNNKKAGSELTGLLRKHINIAVCLVVAADQGKDTFELYQQWSDNATHIAHVYHHTWDRINEKKMNSMMQMHLSTTLNEATAILKKDCQASYEMGEKAYDHILMMSDYIASKF